MTTALLATCGAFAMAACGSDSNSGTDQAPDLGDTTCASCRTPPEKPEDGVPGDGTGATLAISKVFLGDTATDGVPDESAWKSFGYDIDGYKSTKTSTFHCKPYGDAAPSAIQTDGIDGIDNSFGANLLEQIVTFAPDAATQVNQAIQNGTFTVIIDMEDIGGGQNYVDLPAALYAGADRGGAPLWDGSDEWPVYCELMQTCEVMGTPQLTEGNASLVKFPNSYVAGGTWVSGSNGDVPLTLSVAGFELKLNIRKAVITADLSGSPPNGATKGIIAGVLETEELIASLRTVAGTLNTALCEGATFDALADTIRAASDIMSDGKQDPSETCNGISLGLGFEMEPVKLGAVLNQSPEGEPPCPE